MSDLLIVPKGRNQGAGDAARLVGSADLSDGQRFESCCIDGLELAVTSRKDAPLSGSRVHQEGDWTVAVAGDLVDHAVVPYGGILQCLSSGNYQTFAGFEGVFALVAYDNSTRTLYAVSDRRAQKPVFYSNDLNRLLIATNLPSFVRYLDQPAFDKRWLWQMLYFNIPVDDTTFIEGVRRLPPATVMKVEFESGKRSMHEYAQPFRAREPLLKGQEALELIASEFGERVHAHYQGAGKVACALTNGWDGRTLLAMAPSNKDVTAYTYGGPGCGDLRGASATAKAIGVDHEVIPFDQAFVADLPHHAMETVYLSGGLQGVLRATLHHAYETLTDGGARFPLTISGISLGTQLRGAAQYPDLISMELAMRFQGMGPAAGELHRDALPDNEHSAFDSYVEDRLRWLEERFGPLESGETHLAYTVYPASAHYFCGELALADRYTTVRVPAWDSRLIELNFQTEYSTMSFSHFVRKSRKVLRKEMELQAHLIRQFSRDVYRLPVRGIHPAAVLAGEVPYQAERAYRLLQRQLLGRFSSKQTAPLENWNAWLYNDNLEFVKGLLQSSETLCVEFVKPEVLDQTIESGNTRLLGKFLSVELVLRLIRSKWQRFW